MPAKVKERLGGGVDWYKEQDYECELHWAVSHDSVKVPMTIIRKKGRQPGGACLMEVYGGYGVCLDTAWQEERVSHFSTIISTPSFLHLSKISVRLSCAYFHFLPLHPSFRLAILGFFRLTILGSRFVRFRSACSTEGGALPSATSEAGASSGGNGTLLAVASSRQTRPSMLLHVPDISQIRASRLRAAWRYTGPAQGGS